MVAGLAAAAAHRGDCHGCEAGARLLDLGEEGSCSLDTLVLGEHEQGPRPPGSDRGVGGNVSWVPARVWGGPRPLVPWMGVL